jgi:hypothetical protein
MEDIDYQNIEKVKRGRLFDALITFPGWWEVYLPRLKKVLDEADRRCHDGRTREASILYNNGFYNGLKSAVALADLILKEKDIAEKYCEKNGINI